MVTSCRYLLVASSASMRYVSQSNDISVVIGYLKEFNPLTLPQLQTHCPVRDWQFPSQNLSIVQWLTKSSACSQMPLIPPRYRNVVQPDPGLVCQHETCDISSISSHRQTTTADSSPQRRAIRANKSSHSRTLRPFSQSHRYNPRRTDGSLDGHQSSVRL